MKRILIIVMFLFTGNLFAQQVIDRIIAVVENEAILQSELDFQVNYAAAQSAANPNDPALRKQIFNSIIEEKLLYAQAKIDSITVTDEQIDQQLDIQVNYFIQQYGSQENLEKVYGMSIDKIKRELRDDVQKNSMAQALQQKKFGEIEVSRREVEEFYTAYQDSLGLIPEKFKIAHIFVNPQASEKLKNKARKFAESLLDSLKNGADFAVLAKKYSADPGSAAKGGDLGTVKRGVFFPQFEAAAYALQPGERTGIVESPVGFHIIELLERRGESIHTRHILTKIASDDATELEAIKLLTQLRDSIETGKNTFEYFAKKYSDDKNTAPLGGVLGSFEVSQLDKNLRDQVFKLKEGEIGFPKRLDINRNTYGFHIIKLVERIPEHMASLDSDFEEIKQLAIYNKKQKLYSNWIAELKNNIFWSIKSDE